LCLEKQRDERSLRHKRLLASGNEEDTWSRRGNSRQAEEWRALRPSRKTGGLSNRYVGS